METTFAVIFLYTALIVVWVFGTIITWPISLFLHEIGHAIPQLIFTKGEITIGLGESNSKSSSNFCFKISRLNFIIFYKNLWTSGGYARAHDTMPIAKWEDIIISIWGPIFSILVLGGLSWYVIASDVHGSVKFISSILIIHAVIEIYLLFVYQVFFKESYYIFSDAARIFHLVFKKYSCRDINLALHDYYKGNFHQAFLQMQPIVSAGFDQYKFNQAYLLTLCELNKGDKAYDVYISSSHKYIITDIDRSILGVSMITNNYEKGRELIEQAALSDPRDYHILANKAFLELEDGNYEKAIAMFAYIRTSEDFEPYALANLGLAKIYNGDLPGGLSDINLCIEINPLESFGHRNKGIYLYNQGDYKKAIECFRIAHKYNPKTYLIDKYIDKCLVELNKKQ